MNNNQKPSSIAYIILRLSFLFSHVPCHPDSSECQNDQNQRQQQQQQQGKEKTRRPIWEALARQLDLTLQGKLVSWPGSLAG